MQLTIEDISPVEKRVDFEVPWGDVAPRLDRAYGNLRKEVHIKGFRPGKAPREVLERLFRSRVEDEVARDLIESSIGQAIRDNQIEPVAPPRIDKLEMKKGSPFKFSAVVEVRSEVKPENYAAISLAKRAAKTADEEIDRAIEGYRTKMTQFVAIEGRDKIGDDDFLLVEMQGKVGPHKFKRRTGVIDLANEANAPLPGLVPHLRGLPVATTDHEIRYQLPAEERLRELAGQAVSLKITVKEVRQRKVPPLDDSLAKESGEAETLAGLREKVRARLLQADEERVQAELKQQLVTEIVKRNPFPIAPSLVHRHAHAMVERFKVNMQMSGIELEQAGLDEEKLAHELMPQAEQEARASVLLAAIAGREGIEVTDADIQKRIAEMAAAQQESAKKLRAELEKAGRLPSVKRQIQDEKTLDLLLGQSKITDATPEMLAALAKEAEEAAAARKAAHDHAHAHDHHDHAHDHSHDHAHHHHSHDHAHHHHHDHDHAHDHDHEHHDHAHDHAHDHSHDHAHHDHSHAHDHGKGSKAAPKGK